MSERYKDVLSGLFKLQSNAAQSIAEAKNEAKEQIQELDGNSLIYDNWEIFNKKYQELFAKGRLTEANSLKDKFLKENS